jgi:hypothetical protein
VVAVNKNQSLADLQSTNGADAIERHIPFDLIHAVGGDYSPTSMD